MLLQRGTLRLASCELAPSVQGAHDRARALRGAPLVPSPRPAPSYPFCQTGITSAPSLKNLSTLTVYSPTLTTVPGGRVPFGTGPCWTGGAPL